MPAQPSHRHRAWSRAAVLAALVVAAPASAQAGGQLGSGPVIVRPPPSLRETAPESGAGLMTGGSFALVGGTSLIILGSYMAATESSDWAGAIVGGAALAAGGSTFVWLGTRRARTLRAWSEEHDLRPPPKGRALLISGFVLGGGGLISMIAYGGLSLGYCESGCFNPNQGAWFGIAGSAVAVGLGMVVAGAVLRSGYRRWVEEDKSVRVRITPTFAFLPTGAQFGVAGRF
jgi:hypothetical protein